MALRLMVLPRNRTTVHTKKAQRPGRLLATTSSGAFMAYLDVVTGNFYPRWRMKEAAIEECCSSRHRSVFNSEPKVTCASTRHRRCIDQTLEASVQLAISLTTSALVL